MTYVSQNDAFVYSGSFRFSAALFGGAVTEMAQQTCDNSKHTMGYKGGGGGGNCRTYIIAVFLEKGRQEIRNNS